MRTLIGITLSLVMVGLGPAAAHALLQDQEPDLSGWNEARDGPLPRWREGGTPPDDPGQSLQPYAIRLAPSPGDGLTGPPTSGLMASPPEYAPADGVIFRYGGWTDVVTDCVVGLTADPTKDEVAYVVVSGASQQTTATNQFAAAGADMSKVVFITKPTNSIWLRDYGPHFVWQAGALAVADSHYYPTRPLDNFIPTQLAEGHFRIPPYHMGLYYSGGNFQPGPDRSGFITSLINQDNGGFSNEEIESLYAEFQGIDTLHILPRLPGSVDATGHIDMWLYLVDEDTVIISEFIPGSNTTAIEITENAVSYMESLGFDVVRVPAWNAGSVHYTYTNAFRVNDRIFVPIYGPGNAAYLDDDAVALAAWETAAGPGVEIIPINCYSIIPAAGAIHCIVMQVPRYTPSAPAAHVISPDGGDLLVSGTTEELLWVACDDEVVTSVDLECSFDGGTTFPYLVASGEVNDGKFSWLVPPILSSEAMIRVTAYDGDANEEEAVSASVCAIADASQTVYDFSVGATQDRWAWGDRTGSWSELDGIRDPAGLSTQIGGLVSGAYVALSASDATGGDTDGNRYISKTPGSSQESTHVFEFSIAEAPWTIQDIGIRWEGYGDQCLQMEMYVWDDVAGNWGDGAGLVGQNAYLANYAGNRDEDLRAHIRGNFGRYVDLDGRLTLLLYAERSGQESFHDYVSVTVTHDQSLADPWAHLGLGMPGTHGVPTLTGNGTLVAGDPIGVVLEDALESATAWLVVGTSAVNAPFYGGTLVPAFEAPDGFHVPLMTDGSGRLTIEESWPTGVPSGLSLFLQYWVEDPGALFGFAASNAVQGTVP